MGCLFCFGGKKVGEVWGVDGWLLLQRGSGGVAHEIGVLVI